jgi:hypothetical protein
VGFEHAAVMDDSDNRARLVTVDSGLGDTRNICCFLETRRDPAKWKPNNPLFQSGLLRLAGYLAAQLRLLVAEYTECEGSTAGAWLFLNWRIDRDDWRPHNILLLGDNRPHTHVREVEAREGRVLDVLIGENHEPTTGHVNVPQVPVILDAVVLEVVEIGERGGQHDCSGKNKVPINCQLVSDM